MTRIAPLPQDHVAICEAEPITTPGAIQPFGIFLAIEPDGERIAFASTNAQAEFGRPAAELIGGALADLFPAEPLLKLRKLIRAERYAPTNFTSVVLSSGRTADATVHRSGAFVLLELMPKPPGDADREASLAAAAISRTQLLIQEVRRAADLSAMLSVAVDEIRALTGFDRVMAYRFDDDHHGEVVAESAASELEPFLGLHYPATDIPSQARRMYLLQRVRQIPDVEAAPVDVVGAASDGATSGEPSTGPRQLDLTYSVLRAVSPYHVEYLRNMGVRATFAISIIVEDRLWGMIVGHHGSPRAIDCTMRGLLDLVGQTLSIMVDIRGTADRRSQLAARNAAIETIEAELADADSIGAALGAVGDELLEVMGAGGAYVRIGGSQTTFGMTPPEAVCRSVLARLADGETSHAAHAELGAIDSGLVLWRAIASGAAAIFLPNNPGDGIVWFRPERRHSVAWGGDPTAPIHIDPQTGRLGPRRSFAKWVETVEGTSQPFTPTDIEVAQRLRRALITSLLRISEERLTWVRNFDALTGLLRREIAETRLRRTVAAVDHGVVGVLLVAINRLGAIGERYGVRQAEQVLVAAARRLQQTMRKGEFCARFGEESFMLVVRRDGADDLRRLGAEILDRFRLPLLEDEHAHTVSVRVGIAVHPGASADLLVATAVAAEREAAKDKRGRWVLFERPPERQAPSAADYELEIAPALARGEFRAVFQPIVRLADGATVGVEALARWRSGLFGDVSPAIFIPAAVEAGQIFPLTTAMLDMTFKATGAALREGRIDYVSVNLDLSLLERRSFPAVVLSALHRNGLSASHLVLEVTESALASENAIAALAQLRETGVRIAIDDFGVGYSSLAYLSRMPIDLVKIDRGFIAGACSDERGAALFSSIASLIGSLGFAAVVEGVETAAQQEIALASGCGYGQGFLFARPLEADALAAHLVGADRSE